MMNPCGLFFVRTMDPFSTGPLCFGASVPVSYGDEVFFYHLCERFEDADFYMMV